MSSTPPKLTSPREVAAYLKENGMSPLKKFGQNFLCDENILRKIAEAACPTGACVLEIGMGLGALTHALALRASHLVTVEIDRGLIRAQQEDIGLPENAVLIEGDILETDLEAICRDQFGGAPFYVCGNLPYYITGRILLRLLEAPVPIQAVTAMVQKEVAERLSAKPGDSDYGALTALAGYYAVPETLFTVSPNCFYPAPDVESAVIHINLSKPPLRVSFAEYRAVVNAAFAMRRKTILNNLRRVFGPQAQNMLEECSVAPGSRAQELSPAQFACLASRQRQK